MNKEVITAIGKQLTSQPFLKLQSVSKLFPGSTLVQISKCLSAAVSSNEADFDLICSITVERQTSMLIQYEKWSNITQGFLLYDSPHFEQKIEFKPQQLRELKIVGISQKQCPISQIKRALATPTFQKKHRYINKQILTLKNKALSQHSANSDKNQQIKPLKSVSQPIKVEVKVQRKGQNLNNKPKQQESKLKPLEKRSSKDMQQTKLNENPIKKLLNTKSQEVIQQVKQKNTRTLKMNIESDEEYYEKNKFSKMMDIEQEKGKETDCSGKKKDDEDNDHQHVKKQTTSKFIVDDEEDEDQDLFAKMEQVAKQPQPEQSQSHTQKASDKLMPSQTSKVQNQVKKKANPPSTAPIVSSAAQKGIMGWLTKK